MLRGHGLRVNPFNVLPPRQMKLMASETSRQSSFASALDDHRVKMNTLVDPSGSPSILRHSVQTRSAIASSGALAGRGHISRNLPAQGAVPSRLGWRLPARELEGRGAAAIRQMLDDQTAVLEAAHETLHGLTPH
jgi:hypothetical protein